MEVTRKGIYTVLKSKFIIEAEIDLTLFTKYLQPQIDVGIDNIIYAMINQSFLFLQKKQIEFNSSIRLN